jgi:hypothetical protein
VDYFSVTFRVPAPSITETLLYLVGDVFPADYPLRQTFLRRLFSCHLSHPCKLHTVNCKDAPPVLWRLRFPCGLSPRQTFLCRIPASCTPSVAKTPPRPIENVFSADYVSDRLFSLSPFVSPQVARPQLLRRSSVLCRMSSLLTFSVTFHVPASEHTTNC